MRVRYDEEADALYIKFQEGGYHESDEIKDGFILDYDIDGNIIGIEILDASTHLAVADLSTVNFEITRPLVKAAEKRQGPV
ncbi:DUF2283 domain-containing protein [Candidatus Bipolaricaulota bacterium]|nr:DUF2283 domain-containing protein [Candidatus Bipolaricaulota bacterium]